MICGFLKKLQYNRMWICKFPTSKESKKKNKKNNLSLLKYLFLLESFLRNT